MKPIGVACILIGLAALAWERLVVSGVDENGVLLESFALPLGWFLLVVGGFLLSLDTLRRLRNRRR